MVGFAPTAGSKNVFLFCFKFAFMVQIELGHDVGKMIDIVGLTRSADIGKTFPGKEQRIAERDFDKFMDFPGTIEIQLISQRPVDIFAVCRSREVVGR